MHTMFVLLTAYSDIFKDPYWHDYSICRDKTKIC